jgi:D-tyrosyl-tRNA(Tyr) deacylase
MRACVQRVNRAAVTVEGQIVGAIDAGLLVLLGVAADDSEGDASYLAQKVVQLRVFEDDAGKMNRSLLDADGQMLVVSQFTLLGDCRHGRRPSFIHAAEPVCAERLYECFVNRVESLGVPVARGQFRAQMQVELINDGPVTLLLDSRKCF